MPMVIGQNPFHPSIAVVLRGHGDPDYMYHCFGLRLNRWVAPLRAWSVQMPLDLCIQTGLAHVQDNQFVNATLKIP